MKANNRRCLALLAVSCFFILQAHSNDDQLTVNDNTPLEVENEIHSHLARNCTFSIGQITQSTIPFTISSTAAFNTNFSNITPTTNAISANFVTLPGINNTANSFNATNAFTTSVAVATLPGAVTNTNNQLNNQFNSNVNFNGSNVAPTVFTQQATRPQSGPPGLYCLAPNLAPSVTNTPQLIGKLGVSSGVGITINASNVIIDFNDTVLLGIGGTTGISISGGFSNIIIRNGTIANMPVAGITINNGNSDITGAIVIQNMRFFNNGTAINVIGGFNLIVQNCRSYFSTGNGFTFSQISNSIINNCISNSNNIHGFAISNANSIFIKNCQTQDNTTNGFNISGLTRTIINACIASQNQNGFLITPGATASQDLEINDCFASQNSINGFNITGNSITCNNCTSYGNSIGFLSTGGRISFDNSLAQDNTSNGFQVTGNFATMSNSRASNNAGQGFFINGVSGSILNSISTNNIGNGFQVTGTGLEIVSCHALNNSVNGILVNGFNNTILKCIVTQNNSGNGVTTGNGILLAGTASGIGNVSTNCQLRNCTATGNNTGINNQGTTNRIYSNFANANGTNYINVPNVVVSPSSTAAINFTANISE